MAFYDKVQLYYIKPTISKELIKLLEQNSKPFYLFISPKLNLISINHSSTKPQSENTSEMKKAKNQIIQINSPKCIRT